jgi:hypothetical protein
MNPGSPQTKTGDLVRTAATIEAKREELATTIAVTEDALTAAGFTESGLTHFKKVVSEYVSELLDRTIAYAEADKARA